MSVRNGRYPELSFIGMVLILVSAYNNWCARRDLNSRPAGSKPAALSPELRAHLRGQFILWRVLPEVPSENELSQNTLSGKIVNNGLQA